MNKSLNKSSKPSMSPAIQHPKSPLARALLLVKTSIWRGREFLITTTKRCRACCLSPREFWLTHRLPQPPNVLVFLVVLFDDLFWGDCCFWCQTNQVGRVLYKRLASPELRTYTCWGVAKGTENLENQPKVSPKSHVAFAKKFFFL